MFAQTRNKSFDQTFSKVCGFQRQRLGRRPQTAKPFLGAFLFATFSFAPTWSKEKVEIFLRYFDSLSQSHYHL
jgi:hypothetical protein